MRPHRTLRDVKLVGDLLVEHAIDEILEHAELLRSQRRELILQSDTASYRRFVLLRKPHFTANYTGQRPCDGVYRRRFRNECRSTQLARAIDGFGIGATGNNRN